MKTTPKAFRDSQIITRMVHTKCRDGFYPFSDIKRIIFPDDKVSWSAPFENYNPPNYESPALKYKDWADSPIDEVNFNPKWNKLDGKINRESHIGPYEILNKRPLNPAGRTGIQGRGVLGKWGPNHAADPIVTRWKLIHDNKQLHSESNMPILQFCGIQRKDCGQWAIPGGMVDPGEQVTETLRREFLEEAFNSLEVNPDSQKKNEEIIQNFFQNGTEIYRGYVDDPRNTDNAWMETVAVNFHDDNGSAVGKFDLQAGSDAKNVKWIDIDRSLDLYASHSAFIEAVARLRNAHW